MEVQSISLDDCIIFGGYKNKKDTGTSGELTRFIQHTDLRIWTPMEKYQMACMYFTGVTIQVV